LVVALLLFAAMGIGSTLVDVTGMTLLQRSAPSEVVGRVFGVLQSLMLITIATGALVAPLVVNALGPRPTFVAFGVVLPALAVLTWRVLTAIDRDARVPVEPLELLRAIPIFSPLPEAVLERLAGAAAEVRVPAGLNVFAQGEARVAIDGEERQRVPPGGFFGEIALLRDVPRTATVTAVEPLRL